MIAASILNGSPEAFRMNDPVDRVTNESHELPQWRRPPNTNVRTGKFWV